MIDTIVTTLSNDKFRVTNPDLFQPSARWISDSRDTFGSRSFITSKQNFTVIDKKLGIYKPRLTVTKRFYNHEIQILLKIEFSVTKILFGNNFMEAVESDLELLLIKLQKVLEEMGVRTSAYYLRNSLVSAIHYSKNIVLTSGLTPYSLLKEIQKSNISKRLDFNQTDFRNGGHSIKFRANSFEITFYDKMKDLQMAGISEKRSIENDNYTQLSLFEQLEGFQRLKPFEVIRMEIRLNQRQKIRSILKEININVEPTLGNLFKLEIAQKVLIHYLNLIEDNLPSPVFYKENSPKEFYSSFIFSNPNTKIKEAMMVYGFHKTLSEINPREIREMFKNNSTSYWYKFIKEMKSYQLPRNKASPLDSIRTAVNNYKPLKLDEYNQLYS